jgi:ferredoxin
MAEIASEPRITNVFIIEGCIICGLCEDTAPQIFDVKPATSTIRPNAPKYYRSHSLEIIKAAKECPVDVIRVKGFNEPA